jgi:RsiW-degrading membrane proteinase PrsW (M82 family)
LPFLLVTAALPVFLVYLWFRFSRFPLSGPWFFSSLLAGAGASFIALIFQTLIPPGGADTSMLGLFAGIFLRVAGTEELSRLLALVIFFRICRHLGWDFPGPDEGGEIVWGAACGLVAGLGFAVIENASYGAADISVTFFRAFSAAPLHAACGSRVGSAVLCFREQPRPALGRFFSALAIHGMYNLMLLLPHIPSFLAALAAFFAFGSSLLFIRPGRNKT